ncbi:MAG TPA: VC0807 family protein [Ktedonobacteraceae bacterium]|jgi:hypothetical protein|nr:VC0807 family protein [Ktedonobacteraceae bacterium]
MVKDTAPSIDTANRTKKFATILGITYSIVINGVLPFVIYTLLQNYAHTSEFVALIASGIPPVIDTIIGVIRKGRMDFIAVIALLSIAVSLVLILLGSDPKVYLVRESFFTVAFGLAYLVSFLFPRPLGFYFARAFVTGNVPEKVAWFNSLWQYQEFRHSMRVSTAVWGVGFLLEAAVRTYLVLTLSVSQFLLISPFVLYGIIGAIILWTVLYSRQGSKRANATSPQSAPLPETATPTTGK